jgi:5-formaminoimidazole-4-carboxamide-1-beta-D-ribofuranosyl 5'-monophosphate synthetase
MLINREMVAFNFAPRNSTQAASAMKTGQGGMDWFCFGEESTSSRRVILKIKLRIKQSKLYFVTVGRGSSFP